ncbi:erythromycin resistance leader peptide [Lysinibacillus irui]
MTHAMRLCFPMLNQ